MALLNSFSVPEEFPYRMEKKVIVVIPPAGDVLC